MTEVDIEQQDVLSISSHIEAALSICQKYDYDRPIGLYGHSPLDMHTVLTELLQYISSPDASTMETNGDRILEFINDFYQNVPAPSREFIRMEFRAGYCFYFAHILEKAFPGGTVVWCAPFGHIAYMYDGEVYDIEGYYSGEADFFIPIRYLGDYVKDFTHVPGDAIPHMSAGTVNALIDKYRSEYREIYITMLERYRGKGVDTIIRELDDIGLRQYYCYLIRVPKGYVELNTIATELYDSIMSGEFKFVPYGEEQ